MCGGIRDSLEGGEMNLPTASLPNDVRDRCRQNAATRKDFDSAVGVFNKTPNEREGIEGRVFLAAGQDARESEVNDLVERGEWVGGYVEGAVKNCLTLPARLRIRRQRSISTVPSGRRMPKTRPSAPFATARSASRSIDAISASL